MFKQTRKKLTIIYTISFFLLLLSFILTLYFFITHEIRQDQVRELASFTKEETHELIEHLYDREHDKELSYKPERSLFYYIFDQHGELVEGEETLLGFQQQAEQQVTKVASQTTTITTEWKSAHIIFQLVPVEWNNQNIGTIIVGKDITEQHHLIRNIVMILAILMIIFTILLAFLSYYLAGKAMVPIQNSYEKQRTFVSDASHELRTPLSIFLGSVDLLEREETAVLSPIGREVLHDLRSETMHMSKLLENLLLLSRSDQNHEPITKETLQLSALLSSICHRFQRILPEAIQLTSQIEENISIEADSMRIQQLLYILLENALHYTKKGEIQVTLTSSQRQAFIDIQDSGQGITPKDLPYIFDRFYRADDSRDRSGVGLGLSIAKMIIDNHHGMIQVKSTVGVGTTFSITLPLQKR